MADLVAFLRARLDENEQTARLAAVTGIVEFLMARIAEDEKWAVTLMLSAPPVPAAAAELAPNHPARILTEVVAKRAILNRFHELVAIGIRNTGDGPLSYVECSCGWTGDYEHWSDDDVVFETHLRPLRGPGLTPRWVLVQMASVWRDHPEFDPAWTEET